MAPSLFACFGRGGGGTRSSSATSDQAGAEAASASSISPVLIELFSSQGCADSPAAEAVLSRVGKAGEIAGVAVPVVVVEWHVDYWDYKGWKDLFGSSAWTVRQKAIVEALSLDSMYTPMAVVNGRQQCLGSDEDAIAAAVREAPRFAAPTIQAKFSKPTPEKLQVALAGSLRWKAEGSAGVDVMVALCESGLVTTCDRGDNKGRVLKNDHVVRRLEKLCSTAKKSISGSVQFSLWDGFDGSRCSVVVFVQNSSLQISGVQQLAIPDTV